MRISRDRIPCPICAGTAFALVYDDAESKVLRCRGCDLVFFNPLPTPAWLADFYGSQQGYLPSIEENLRSFRADPSAWRSSATHLLDQLRRHHKLARGTRILDVGCAYGFFLHFAAEAGLDAHGLEISPETSASARERGLDVRTGTLAEAPFEPKSFDIVTFNNVLEHSTEPLEDLRRVHGLLARKGLLYLAVPNIDSLVARADNYFWKMKSWPNHLFYFSRETLERMVAKAGYDVVESFTQQGESDRHDDLRVLRDRLYLEDDERLGRAFEHVQDLGLGQELVVIARKG